MLHFRRLGAAVGKKVGRRTGAAKGLLSGHGIQRAKKSLVVTEVAPSDPAAATAVRL